MVKATTLDGFLNGKVKVRQPVNGYRAATDPVLLAAAIPATAGDRVFDLGCGVGVASLCLGARVNGLSLVGLEIQDTYTDLARLNARENGLDFDIVLGDAAALPEILRSQNFDHVLTNPPFYDPKTISAPMNAGKRTAFAETADLGAWIAIGLKRLRPKGTFTIIQRADRLADVLAALDGPCGDIRILPISAREGRAAGRVLVQAQKGSKSPLTILPPFVMHANSKHLSDGDDLSLAAKIVLRDGQAIHLSH